MTDVVICLIDEPEIDLFAEFQERWRHGKLNRILRANGKPFFDKTTVDILFIDGCFTHIMNASMDQDGTLPYDTEDLGVILRIKNISKETAYVKRIKIAIITFLLRYESDLEEKFTMPPGMLRQLSCPLKNGEVEFYNSLLHAIVDIEFESHSIKTNEDPQSYTQRIWLKPCTVSSKRKLTMKKIERKWGQPIFDETDEGNADLAE